MILFILFITGLLYVTSFFIPEIKNKKASTLFGSAHFKSKSKSMLSTDHNGIAIGDSRLSLEVSYMHAILLAPTGQGKTTRLVLPSLISHLHDCKSNILLIDVKSEMTQMLSPVYEKNGYKVLTLDFDNPSSSFGYNPLAQCKTEDDIKQLAHDLYAISTSKSKASEAIWAIGAKKLISIGLSCILNAPDPKLHTIDALIKLLSMLENGTLKAEYFVRTNAPDEDVWERFQSFQNLETKIKLGYTASAQASLDIWDLKSIRHLTSFDTFPLDKLRKEKVAIFLKLRTGTSSKYGAFLSLFFTQLFRHLLNTPLSKNDRPLFLYLEEFQNIKRIPMFEKSIALLRSKKVSVTCITQNISAIDYVYGKEISNTILANTNTLIALPGIREERTLAYLEKLMGHKTEEFYVSGRLQLSRRSLMTQSEIRRMNHCLLIHGNNQPEKFSPIPIYKNQELMDKAGLVSIDGEIRYKDPNYTPKNINTLPPYEPVTIKKMLEPEKEEIREKLTEILSE